MSREKVRKCFLLEAGILLIAERTEWRDDYQMACSASMQYYLGWSPDYCYKKKLFITLVSDLIKEALQESLEYGCAQ